MLNSTILKFPAHDSPALKVSELAAEIIRSCWMASPYVRCFLRVLYTLTEHYISQRSTKK